MTRRRFCAGALGLGLGSCAFACGFSDGGAKGTDADIAGREWPAPVNGILTLELSVFSELLEVGGWARGVPLEYGQAVIVAHLRPELEASAFVALNGECTHQYCGLLYEHNEQTLICPCHGSIFDLDGQVTKGPAIEVLSVYDVALQDDALLVTLG